MGICVRLVYVSFVSVACICSLYLSFVSVVCSSREELGEGEGEGEGGVDLSLKSNNPTLKGGEKY